MQLNKHKPTPRNRKAITKYDKLYKKCWKVFALYIRTRDKNICFTCGKKEIKKGQYHAGHWLHATLDFDERNVNGQCSRCNRYLHGNGILYTLNMIDLHGRRAVNSLLKDAQKEYRPSERQLNEYIEHYGELTERFLK